MTTNQRKTSLKNVKAYSDDLNKRMLREFRIANSQGNVQDKKEHTPCNSNALILSTNASPPKRKARAKYDMNGKRISVTKKKKASDETALLADMDWYTRVFLWGSNAKGQCFENEKILCKTNPVLLSTLEKAPKKLSSNAYKISCGHDVSAIISENGDLYTWGSGPSLGRNMKFSRGPMKVRIDQVEDISIGETHSCARTHKGRVYIWGSSGDGKLGLGDNLARMEPTRIMGCLKDKIIIDIACGQKHTCLVSNDGSVYSFGNGTAGQLGHGNLKNLNRPKRISTLGDIRSVACGANHTVCLKNNGHVHVFGWGEYGRLGLGDDHMVNTPKHLFLDDAFVVEISCGYAHTMLLTDTGEVAGFGWNEYGQVRQHPQKQYIEYYDSPQFISELSGYSIFQISCGFGHSAAIAYSGECFTWGFGEEGQLANGGEGSCGLATQVFFKIPFPVVSLSLGHTHTGVILCKESAIAHDIKVKDLKVENHAALTITKFIRSILLQKLLSKLVSRSKELHILESLRETKQKQRKRIGRGGLIDVDDEYYCAANSYKTVDQKAQESLEEEKDHPQDVYENIIIDEVECKQAKANEQQQEEEEEEEMQDVAEIEDEDELDILKQSSPSASEIQAAAKEDNEEDKNRNLMDKEIDQEDKTNISFVHDNIGDDIAPLNENVTTLIDESGLVAESESKDDLAIDAVTNVDGSEIGSDISESCIVENTVSIVSESDDEVVKDETNTDIIDDNGLQNIDDANVNVNDNNIDKDKEKEKEKEKEKGKRKSTDNRLKKTEEKNSLAYYKKLREDSMQNTRNMLNKYSSELQEDKKSVKKEKKIPRTIKETQPESRSRFKKSYSIKDINNRVNSSSKVKLHPMSSSSSSNINDEQSSNVPGAGKGLSSTEEEKSLNHIRKRLQEAQISKTKRTQLEKQDEIAINNNIEKNDVYKSKIEEKRRRRRLQKLESLNK